MHAPRLANTPASRSSQTAQATPKGLLRLTRAFGVRFCQPVTRSECCSGASVACQVEYSVFEVTGWIIKVQFSLLDLTVESGKPVGQDSVNDGLTFS